MAHTGEKQCLNAYIIVYSYLLYEKGYICAYTGLKILLSASLWYLYYSSLCYFQPFLSVLSACCFQLSYL